MKETQRLQANEQSLSLGIAQQVRGMEAMPSAKEKYRAVMGKGQIP